MNTTSRTETIERTERPWGWYETVSEVSGNKVKRIRVHPGQKLSLQKHHQRAEHWVVVQGTARVTVGERSSLAAIWVRTTSSVCRTTTAAPEASG